MEPLAVSPDEAALLLGLKRTKVYELLADGTLRSLKVGRRRLIPTDALREFINPPAKY